MLGLGDPAPVVYVVLWMWVGGGGCVGVCGGGGETHGTIKPYVFFIMFIPPVVYNLHITVRPVVPVEYFGRRVS